MIYMLHPIKKLIVLIRVQLHFGLYNISRLGQNGGTNTSDNST